MHPARSALLGLVLVLSALLACKKNRPLTLSTPSNQPVPPPEAGAPTHKQISADTYSVECWGSNVDCVKEAASVCQKGYDVLATTEGAALEAGATPPAPAPAPMTDAAAPTDAAPPPSPPAPAPAATPAPTDAGVIPPAANDAGAPRIEMIVKCKA